AARVSAATPGPDRVAGDAGPRRLAGDGAVHIARQRDRRPHRAAPAQSRHRPGHQVDPHRARRGLHGARGRAVIRRWRPLPLRLSLTLCYAGAMAVILAVYAAGVYAFVSRSLSDTLDQHLRADFWLTAATIDAGPAGTITWFDPEEGTADEDSLWLQV